MSLQRCPNVAFFITDNLWWFSVILDLNAMVLRHSILIQIYIYIYMFLTLKTLGFDQVCIITIEDSVLVPLHIIAIDQLVF